MIKRHILSSVGVIGLASGLAATPALASGGEEEGADAISLEARGTFEGFQLEPTQPLIATPDTATIELRSVEAQLAAAPISPTPEMIASVSTALERGESSLIASITGPDPRLLVRDDVGVDFGDPDDVAPYAVQIFIQDNTTGGVFFNCSGSVINPRTILTAAHCLNGSDGPISTISSETYGLPGEAGTSLLISTGPSSADRLFTYLGDGSGYADGGVATSTDVIIHPTANPDNEGLGFPWGDVALIAVDSPITDVPSLPILLTPLTELTHVIQVGYGTNGTGLTGGTNAGSRFLRRVGENMLGLVGSTGDFIDGVFPDFAPSTQVLGFESQAYYWTDFDNPDRTPEEQAGCSFTGTNISCGTLADVLAIDFFDGDALPGEAGTGPGDSGSPLVADQLADFPLAIGVLSGGFDFFGLGGRYSDVSFYNPLYPFFEFITENTSYKYVSANFGFGDWSDPNHWTQDLDPGFFIQDETGAIVNGIPTGNEPGITESGPKLGTVLGQDISGNTTDITPGFENVSTEVPESSVLLGPGSTGFVPNNTDGTVGTAFEAPAQYFDVILNRFGRTTVDIDVEIDKLTVDNIFAGIVLPEEQTLTTIIGFEQFNGLSTIDGTLNADVVAVFGGFLDGSGTINTDVFFNISGAVVPGGLFGTGTLNVNGAYVQSSGGTMLSSARFTRRRGGSVAGDLVAVTGDASLAGSLILTATGRPRFGDEVTVLTANSVLGNFDDVFLLARSPLLFAETRVEDGNVIAQINALRLRDLFSSFGNLASLGQALDTIRFGGNFDQFSGLFDVIDGAGINTLVPTLSSLTPVSAFNQSTIATNFSQRFTGQLGQRTLSLRGANKAAAGFSSAGNAAFAIAGTDPAQTGKVGFFSTVSGVFLNGAAERNTGANAFEEAAFTQAGELTLGADMRVADGISVGFAMTNIRNSNATAGASFRQEDTSTAAAAYAAAQFGKGFADMYLGFSRQNLGVERASQGDFTRAYETATGAADGAQTFAGMRVGYAIDVAPGLEFGPVASVDFVNSAIGGYDEFGAGVFGLSVHGRDFTSVGSKLGVMGALDTRLGRTSSLSAFGSVAYARELADTQDVVTANFFGAPDAAFSIVNELDPQWVSINAGVELGLGANFSLSASGTSDLGRGVLTNNQGRVTLNWRF